MNATLYGLIIIGIFAGAFVLAFFRIRSVERYSKAATPTVPMVAADHGAIGSDLSGGMGAQPFDAGCHVDHGGGDCSGHH